MNKKYSTLFLCAAFAVGAQAAEETAKADVLGRHISSVRNTPKAYVKDVKKQADQKVGLNGEKKALARVSGYTYPTDENNISFVTRQGTFSAIMNNSGSIVKTYTRNGGSVTESQYLNWINNIENADAARKQYSNQYTRYVDNQNHNLYDVRRAGDDGYQQNYYQTNYEGETIRFWKYDKLKKDVSNLTAYTDNAGYTGSGIGISMTAEGLPLMYYPHAPADKFTVLHNPVNSDAQRTVRGTMNARVLNNVAPGAYVYGLQNRCGNGTGGKLFAPDGYNKNPKIFIGVHTDACGWSYVYEDQSKNIDDFVYNTRTIEIAPAGLGKYYMSDIGLGVNVITVGAVKSSVNNIQTLSYHQGSGADNPTFRDDSTKYVKPEIANISDFLFPQYYGIAMDGGDDEYWGGLTSNWWKVVEPYYGGGLAATSYTAATVALLLQRYPFYKWHPEVVKALLITSSVKSINNASSYDNDNNDDATSNSNKPNKYAMGIPKGEALFVNNRSRFWNGKNGDFFNSGLIQFNESNIDSTKKYRIAIAWLSRGSVVFDYQDIPQDIDLEVWQGDTRLGISSSWHNSFEFVEVYPTTNDPLTIKIRRYNNIGGRVLLGYNLHELDK